MKLTLTKKYQIAPDITTFYFKPEVPFEWQPGQFLRYHISEPTPDERGENRFFSIASAPFEKHIQLTTKFSPNESSSFKQDLNKLNIGDSLEAFGPSGSFSINDTNKEYVFIAGGIGITPFRAILANLDHQNVSINIRLIYANRTTNILFKDELESLAQKHPELRIFYIISDELVKPQKLTDNITIIPGRIDGALIKKLIPNLLKPTYYISGPEQMVMDLEKVIWDMGIPKENTKRDYFPGYKQY